MSLLGCALDRLYREDAPCRSAQSQPTDRLPRAFVAHWDRAGAPADPDQWTGLFEPPEFDPLPCVDEALPAERRAHPRYDGECEVEVSILQRLSAAGRR